MKKLFAVVLTLTALSLSACAGNNGSSQTEQSTAHTDESTISSTSDEISEITNAEENEFDFDEAVKNITLFDSKISLPCTIKDFGENFCLNNAMPAAGAEDQMYCELMYREKMIGNVMLQNCKEEDSFEDKQIISLHLGDSNWSYPFDGHKEFMEKLGKYTDLIRLDFGGISMSSNEEQIRAILGESPVVTELDPKRYLLDYNFEHGRVSITISDDKINAVLISFNKIINIDYVSDETKHEFDVDEAVKNLTLFGSKISLPCTIEDFGEDYSLREDNLSMFGDIASCGVLYQGKSIGTVSLSEYKDGDYLNDKQIISLSLGFIATDDGLSDLLKDELYERRGWYNGLIEVDFGGLSFGSTEAEVKSVLGEPVSIDSDSAKYELYSDDRSKCVKVSFYRDKVKRIIIDV